MTDYHNEETASWDARQVREEAAAAVPEEPADAAETTETAEPEAVQEPEEQKGEEESVPRKKQPKPQKPYRYRRHLNPVLYVIMVMIISGLAACIGWLLMDDVCSLNKPWTEVSVQVTKSDDLKSVSQKLKSAGLVNYPWLFEIFGKVIGAEEDIGVGTFTLNSNMDYFSLVDGMYVSTKKPVEKLETVTVSIPEGYNVREIIKLLASKGVNTEEKLTEAAETVDFDYDFIDNESEDISRLEGYLFPDTYEFYVGHDPKGALTKLLSNFNKKMTAERKGVAAEMGRTVEEILIIASLIEKETDGSDRDKIASVIYNRLNDTSGKHGTNGILGIDAALLYVLPDANGVITQADLELDSPYNLRKKAGLTPTPIANPGLASIDAALHPADTDYYYYALGKDGRHHFFKTLKEHTAFVQSSEYGG